MADGGGQVQLTADPEAEFQLIAHRAGGPGVVGHPGHGSEAQAGDVADHLKHRRHGADPANGGDVGSFLVHAAASVRNVVGEVRRPM
ncbi:hypothetical protein VRB30_18475 [Pseudomonas poae]|uniref:hypothetical protein n=1 Tax=Pseudomonas poae TaxID=200451 RepID=UPI0030E19390